MHVPRRLELARAICCAAFFVSGLSSAADPPKATAPPAEAAGSTSFKNPDKSLHALLVTSRFAKAAVVAALSASHQGEAWARIVGMEARARTAAVLPELILRVVRNTNELLRLSPTVDDPYNYSAAGGAGWLLEGRLIWHFDRLIFDTHEVPIARLRMEQADRAGRLVSKVLSTLFEWQRAALRATDPKATLEDQEKAELTAAEAEVVLDQLTGGWFGAELARRRATE